MNAARLARMLNEAGDDKGRWAEAICDEITEPSTGLVTKGHLDKRLAEHETRMFRTLVATQAAAFFALAVLILLRS
jgi:hypothetical protein